jgi:hypothetical protein
MQQYNHSINDNEGEMFIDGYARRILRGDLVLLLLCAALSAQPSPQANQNTSSGASRGWSGRRLALIRLNGKTAAVFIIRLVTKN